MIEFFEIKMTIYNSDYKPLEFEGLLKKPTCELRVGLFFFYLLTTNTTDGEFSSSNLSFLKFP